MCLNQQVRFACSSVCTWLIVASSVWSVERTFLVDDFNDGDDEGWAVLDATNGEPSYFGLGTVDPSGSSYVFTGERVTPTGTNDVLASQWIPSSDGFFSNGYVRATIRSENLDTHPVVFLRSSPTLETGYAFIGDPDTGEFYVYRSDDYSEGPFIGFNIYGDSPYTVGIDWMLEAGAVGDVLSLKVWAANEVEPATPTWALRDSTYSSGLFGLAAVHGGDRPPQRISAVIDDVYFTIPDGSCDFNSDNRCDVDDLDMISAAGNLVEGVDVPAGNRLDLTDDGIVSADDIREWLSNAAVKNGLASPYHFGDANLDGVVNDVDFQVWNANRFGAFGLWSHADFNGDGATDVSDFNLWLKHRGMGSSSQSVPEPFGAHVALWFAVAAIRRRMGLGCAKRARSRDDFG
ncbi:MAG: hypothetical protein KDA60_08520, partial [Planctomycetales bacterium]|nr:hypothetical protein [Planctomycetales bacterium]